MPDTGNSHPIRSGAFIGLGVFLLVGGLWQSGWMQGPELWIYDHFVDWSTPLAEAAKTDPNTVLILQDEDDIRTLDYPLRDATVAELLDKIESGHPAVIGVDLYRDIPEPRDGSGTAALEQALMGKPTDPAPNLRKNIIAIYSLGQTQEKPMGIPPPACLNPHHARYGFNQFPYDYKTVRRGFMNFQFQGSDPHYSFATAITLSYLRLKGVPVTARDDMYVLGGTPIIPFRATDGGYMLRGNESDQASGYQFMIDFRGPRRFECLSVSQALKLEDTSVFRDKIVLIGSKADSSNDVHETPVTRSLEHDDAHDMPGVEIHAHVIRQLLDAALRGRAPLVSASLPFRWLFLFASCLLAVPIALDLRSYLLFALAVVLGIAAIFLAGWFLFLHGYWTIIFYPAAGLLVSSGLIKAYAVTHEERQRAQLMSLFSQRTSPEIAKEIWANRDILLEGGRIAARRLVVTVLFTDLKNFSTISENMSPAELLGWINEYQIAMTRHVVSNHGDINAYTGDGMMAVFGAPIARQTEEEMKTDATNAVRSALNMGRDIRKMNAQWKAQGRPLAGLRVGIFTGEVMGGEIGDEGHREYTVLGDTVNTASRLESMDKEGELTGGIGDCRILIGSLTYEYVKEHFPARHVATVNLKGKNQQTDVYIILEEGESVEQTLPQRS